MTRSPQKKESRKPSPPAASPTRKRSSRGTASKAPSASAPATHPTAQTAVYLYCLLSAPKPPPLEEVPAGLPHASPPRLLQAEKDLWLVVADAPLSEYSEETIKRGLADEDLSWVSQCAVAHEAVVEHFAQEGTVIPYKLFTLFETEARALALVRSSRRSLSRVIARVSGREEWGLRISFDEAKARHAAQERIQREVGQERSGLAFLMRKKQEKDIAQKTSKDARKEAERLFAALSRRADEVRRRPPLPGPDGAHVLLEAAFLIPSQSAARFASAVQEEAERLAPEGYQLTLSGPWPPYHFISEPS